MPWLNFYFWREPMSRSYTKAVRIHRGKPKTARKNNARVCRRKVKQFIKGRKLDKAASYTGKDHYSTFYEVWELKAIWFVEELYNWIYKGKESLKKLRSK